MTLMLLGVPAPALAHPPWSVSNVKPYLRVRPAKISYTGDGTGSVGGLDGTAPGIPGIAISSR